MKLTSILRYFSQVHYFDSLASNRIDPFVLDAMMPYCTQLFGNPHSKNHSYGWVTE